MSCPNAEASELDSNTCAEEACGEYSLLANDGYDGVTTLSL
jgi:hypothetical protein